MAIINGSGIISQASKLELEYQVSIAQVKSQGGLRRAQRRGPLLYNLKIVLEPARINSDRYYSIMNEILALNYGGNTLRFALDAKTFNGRAITTPRGAWNGSSGHSVPAVSPSNGQSVIIAGFIADGSDTTVVAKSFDYVQFEGSTKVYQVAPTISGNSVSTLSNIDDNYYADINGQSTINLNTPLVADPSVTSSNNVVFGEDVVFHMAMMKKPKITYLPGDIVEFGDIKFEEIIDTI